jgi:hypothetical protein
MAFLPKIIDLLVTGLHQQSTRRMDTLTYEGIDGEPLLDASGPPGPHTQNRC